MADEIKMGDEVTTDEGFTGIVMDDMDNTCKVMALTGFYVYQNYATVTRTGRTFSLDAPEVKEAARKMLPLF